MGRLQALASRASVVLGLVALGGGCDGPHKTLPVPTARNEAVLAASASSPPAPSPAASHAEAAPPAKPRVLCTEPPLDRPLTNDRLAQRQAPGAAPLGSRLPVGDGRWTWINLWAAWCAPCREEIPRLLAWQKRLGGAMAVTFVSLDDDERELTRFIGAQPPDGLRASFWLPDGKGREAWLSALHLSDSLALPVQLLVTPQGRVHCLVQGAVEESDFAQVAAIVAHR